MSGMGDMGDMGDMGGFDSMGGFDMTVSVENNPPPLHKFLLVV